MVYRWSVVDCTSLETARNIPRHRRRDGVSTRSVTALQGPASRPTVTWTGDKWDCALDRLQVQFVIVTRRLVCGEASALNGKCGADIIRDSSCICAVFVYKYIYWNYCWLGDLGLVWTFSARNGGLQSVAMHGWAVFWLTTRRKMRARNWLVTSFCSRNAL